MLIDITILLDRSGSMETGRTDHEGGLRSFIRDQQGESGETNFTLIQFDDVDPFEIVYDNIDINDIDTSEITLTPRGCTPLLDSVGKTIAYIENKQRKADQTILMIISDGLENSSREWNKQRVKDAIKKHDDDWKILYLGANQDSFAEAGSFGVQRTSAMNFAPEGPSVGLGYQSTSNATKRMRSAVLAGVPKDVILASGSLCAEEYLAQQNYADNTKGLNALNETEKTEVTDASVSSSSTIKTN